MASFRRSLLLLEWDDSTSDDNWQVMDGVDNTPIRIKSVGWRIKEDRKNLTIAMNVSGTGKVSELMTIPKGCIRKRQRLA